MMGVMQRLANAPREMGVGRGNDHPFGGFDLVLDLDNSSQRMFGFDTSLFIAGEPEHLVPMLGDKLTGKQQHPARRALPCTGRAHDVVTVRWDRVPRPPAFVVDRFALTTDGWLPEAAAAANPPMSTI